jgi:hypothetical protein
MPTEHSSTHTSWGAFLARPAVFVGMVAAAASVAVAVAGAISGSISSFYQDRSEQAKLHTTALLELIKYKPDEQSERVRQLIQAGILKDEDGKICKAFLVSGCPIK